MVIIDVLPCDCCVDGSYTPIPQSSLFFSLCFVCFSAKQIAGLHKYLIAFPFSFCFFLQSHLTGRDRFFFPTLIQIRAAWGRLKDLCVAVLLPSLGLRFLEVEQDHL